MWRHPDRSVCRHGIRRYGGCRWPSCRRPGRSSSRHETPPRSGCRSAQCRVPAVKLVVTELTDVADATGEGKDTSAVSLAVAVLALVAGRDLSVGTPLRNSIAHGATIRLATPRPLHCVS